MGKIKLNIAQQKPAKTMKKIRKQNYFRPTYPNFFAILRGRLHGRVVPAKRVDSRCRVDPLPLCIVYYFDISITCKASCLALHAGTAAVACRVNSLSRDRNCPHIPCNRFLPSWLGKVG
jgi:hypothetical protein